MASLAKVTKMKRAKKLAKKLKRRAARNRKKLRDLKSRDAIVY